MKLKIFHQLCGGKYNIIFRFTDLSFTLVTLLRRVFRLSRNTRYWTHSSLIHNFHTSLHGYSLLLQLPTAWTVDSDANFGCLGFHWIWKLSLGNHSLNKKWRKICYPHSFWEYYHMINMSFGKNSMWSNPPSFGTQNYNISSVCHSLRGVWNIRIIWKSLFKCL